MAMIKVTLVLFLSAVVLSLYWSALVFSHTPSPRATRRSIVTKQYSPKHSLAKAAASDTEAGGGIPPAPLGRPCETEIPPLRTDSTSGVDSSSSSSPAIAPDKTPFDVAPGVDSSSSIPALTPDETPLTPCDVDHSFATYPAPDSCISRYPGATDRRPLTVCPQDLAIALLTSKFTAPDRLPRMLSTWVATARAVGVAVEVYSAEALPEFPEVHALGISSVSNNNGRSLSFMGLKRLFGAHPGKKWYFKADDDTFVYPTNLLHELSQWPLHGANDAPPQLGRAIHGWGNFSGPHWRAPVLAGRINLDKYTVSGGAGFALSAGLLQALGGEGSPVYDLCLNGTSFPDVDTFDGGHGYNEDWLWKKCLALHAPTTQFYNIPSLHMSPPLEQWAGWQAGDTVAHFPSTFHWVKDSHTVMLLDGCKEETKRIVVQTAPGSTRVVRLQDHFKPTGCQCTALGSVAGSPAALCDLGSLYGVGFGGCEEGCHLFPNSGLNGGGDACVSSGGIAPAEEAPVPASETNCPQLPVISGVRTGAYFVCNYPLDWACFGATAKNLAQKLSTPDFPLVYDPACFDVDVHPRVYFCGGHGVQGHPLYNSSDVRIIINAEAEGMAAVAPFGAYDLGITGIIRVPRAELQALGEAAGVQVYLPFVSFGVLQNEGLSEMDLLRVPPLNSGPGSRPLFAAYASSHCGVPVRNQMYALLNAHRPVHGLNKNCHNGEAPPGGNLTDRRDEKAWMTTVVERFSQYKFAVVFENQIVPGYLTEKLANAKKAGAVPIYWGTAFAAELFNPAAFVDCSPRGNETQAGALERCVAEVVRLDQNDAAWSAMVREPFMRSGEPIDYAPLGAVMRGILECKRLGGCGDVVEGTRDGPVCQHARASPLMRQAYFVPRRFGGCDSG